MSWTTHLPMTGADWDFFTGAMAQVRAGQWGQPELVAFEYGGVGSIFGAVTETDVLAQQVPRLYTLVKDGLLLSISEAPHARDAR